MAVAVFECEWSTAVPYLVGTHAITGVPRGTEQGPAASLSNQQGLVLEEHSRIWNSKSETLLISMHSDYVF